jgi:MarR family transcriptional regulator, organic hydroperoxide resistance regulator
VHVPIDDIGARVSIAQPHQPRLDDLIEAERDIVDQLGDLPVDFDALALISNLYRAAAAIRREMEQTVLAEARLSWTAFVTLWVLWIWGEMETRHLAAEANVTKGTLTGVVDTLERRGLVERRRGEDDRRLVTVTLTDQGRELITDVFPRFNAQERRVADMVAPRQRKAMTSGLRQIIRGLSDGG